MEAPGTRPGHEVTEAAFVFKERTPELPALNGQARSKREGLEPCDPFGHPLSEVAELVRKNSAKAAKRKGKAHGEERG